MPLERIVAIGLLTQNDGQLLGPSFDRAWPIEEVPAFPDLLQAVDKQTLGWPQSVSSRNLHFLTLSRAFADLRLGSFRQASRPHRHRLVLSGAGTDNAHDGRSPRTAFD